MPRSKELERLRKQIQALSQSVADLEARFETAVKVLATVHRLSETLVSSLSLEEATRAMVDALVRELPDADKCSILLYNQEEGLLKLAAARGQMDLLGEDEPHNRGLAFRPGEGLAGRVFAEGRPYFVNQETTESRLIKKGFGLTTPVSLACLPLHSLGRRLGVLNISFPAARTYDPPRRRDLVVLAGVVANIVQTFLFKSELDRRVLEQIQLGRKIGP